MTKSQKRKNNFNRFLTCKQWIIDTYGVSATEDREQFKKLSEIWIRNNPDREA
jgi:hypothetical protein